MLYATVDDLESGWRVMTEAERGIAATLLLRASAKLDERIRMTGRDPGELTVNQLQIAQAIVCEAVSYTFDRANMAGSMFTGDAGDIYASDMQGGEVRITDMQMRMLGLGSTRAGFIGVR